ncbi:MAG: hypothetical protein LBF75_02210 [Treponema sp.]|jgi:hypothetical protein|nr:hypothetical protein [Treponema sp.]
MDYISNMKGKLRIGILIGDIEKLKNWEYRILKGIIEHPNLELCLFIRDGRKQIHSLKNRLKRNLLTTKIFANVLYTLQMKIESFVFKSKQTVDTKEIINKIKNTETVYLSPVRKGFLDIFSKEDSDKIKSYGLDIILRHEFNIIRGDILNSARYGIWSYHHADNAINRGGPAGFWEIVNNEPYCGVTLQQLTPELDGGLVIDKAWFNWHWSFFKNNNDLLEKSVVLLFKNINKLLNYSKIDTKKSLTYYNRLYKKPTITYILIYMFRFYFKVFTHIFNKIFPLRRLSCWTLIFGKGKFIESTLFRTNPVSMPRNVFWADPFIYEYDNQLYVFFENYSYKTKKGKISVGKVAECTRDRYSVVDVQDILDFDYHVSYPQIIEEDGELFLIPETYQSKRLEVYRCVQFPCKWELYSTAFDGEEVVDTTYFSDGNGDRWLLLNKGWTHEAELHIYKIDNLKLEKVIAHRSNPVLIDCRKARNGGMIFKYENEYYRPSQINTHGIYGKGLQISKIKKLTLDIFEDEPVIAIEPHFTKGLMGIHHLHQLENNFVFDVCYNKL